MLATSSPSYTDYSKNLITGIGFTTDLAWNVLPRTFINFDADTIPDDDLIFEAYALPHIKPDKDLLSQEIKFSINGRYIDNVTITELKMQRFAFKIPKGALVSGANSIGFEFPNATTPMSLGVNNDGRHLAVGFEWFRIRTSPKYELGKNIVFTENDAANLQYLVSGFSYATSNVVWNNGNEAVIAFELNDISSDLVFDADLYPHIVKGKLNSQEIRLVVNGKPADNITLTKSGLNSVRLNVPKTLLVDGENEFKFELPNAATPKSLSVNEDYRKLAMALERFQIRTSPKYEIGQNIVFAENNAANLQYLISGFSYVTDNVIWNNGNEARMVFNLNDISSDLVFDADLYPHIVKGKLNSQEIRLVVNGKPASKIKLTKSGLNSVRLNIPKTLLVNGENEFKFELPNAATPKSLGVNEDYRKLAMALISFKISKK
jgi:hypothetical protein